jgi:hypothetical protein
MVYYLKNIIIFNYFSFKNYKIIKASLCNIISLTNYIKVLKGFLKQK